jgi:hypothetical protein
MERTRAPRRSPLRNAAIIILLILLAIYIPFRIRMTRDERSREKPAAGTRISIFVTNELAGYREPCG